MDSVKSTNLIKESNLNLMRKTLRRVRRATKPQLSELTGLSVVTINSLVRTLLEQGEILKDEQVQARMGRPATAYSYNAAFKLALIVYMHEKQGLDRVFFSVCNLFGEVVEKVEMGVENVCIECFDANIGRVLEKYPAVKVIGFGIPGREVDGRLAILDYDGLRDAPLRAHIEAKFGLPVVIENDIMAATLGYCHSQKKESGCVIGLYFPKKYAPGSGICMGGELIRGSNGLAGEIKYLPFGWDWEKLGESEGGTKEAIVKTIRTYMALYNPSSIVLYNEGEMKDIARLVEAGCLTEMEMAMLPEIIPVEGMNTHFELGMIRLVLQMIGI